MDYSVLWELSYGVYAISVNDRGRPTGCIVNTVFQVTSSNPIIAVSINKDNYTCDVIKRINKFCISILSEETAPLAIGRLGFTSGRDFNKFEDIHYEMFDELPLVKENSIGHLICEVISITDAETHLVILARVKDTIKDQAGTPMTYRYYHEVVKGKAPKNAPTYRQEEPEVKQSVCSVCGYVYNGDISQESDDYICPICGAEKSLFKD